MLLKANYSFKEKHLFNDKLKQFLDCVEISKNIIVYSENFLFLIQFMATKYK